MTEIEVKWPELPTCPADHRHSIRQPMPLAGPHLSQRLDDVRLLDVVLGQEVAPDSVREVIHGRVTYLETPNDRERSAAVAPSAGPKFVEKSPDRRLRSRT